MKCDKCRNYQIDMDGTNEGYYTACKSEKRFSTGKEKLTREHIEKVMSDKIISKWNYCQGFEKL